MLLWRLAGPKSSEHASRLEIQRRVMFQLKSKGSPKASGTPSSLEYFSLFSFKVFSWLESNLHIMEGNLL